LTDKENVDEKKIWTMLKPIITQSSIQLFYRFDQVNDLLENDKTEDRKQCRFDLPTFSKYLLVAAYCASYNPKSSDRRFFDKVSSLVVRLL
jgi:hypothetical protein